MARAFRLLRSSAAQRAEESLVSSGSVRVIEACRGLGGKRRDIPGVYVLSKALIRSAAPILGQGRLSFSGFFRISIYPVVSLLLPPSSLLPALPSHLANIRDARLHVRIAL